MSINAQAQQILLVDGDAGQRGTVADMLRGEGLDVCAVRTGDEAADALRQRRPPFSMVVTSLVLPGKGGLEIIRAALKHDPDCSVMAIGASAIAGMAADALAIGAYAVVPQPVQPEQFRGALKRFVERSGLMAERRQLMDRVAELESKVDALEAAVGRMEMLAQQISPAAAEQKSRPLEELEQLASLRSKGALTEGQFQSMRQSLLMRWSS
jgi:DNA-binding NtrC family response regulator